MAGCPTTSLMQRSTLHLSLKPEGLLANPRAPTERARLLRTSFPLRFVFQVKKLIQEYNGEMREPAYAFDEVMRVSVWRPRDFPEASTEAAWKKLRGHMNEQIAAHCVDDANSASRTNAQSQMAEWEAQTPEEVLHTSRCS